LELLRESIVKMSPFFMCFFAVELWAKLSSASGEFGKAGLPFSGGHDSDAGWGAVANSCSYAIEPE
jgi:hypothetical protein